MCELSFLALSPLAHPSPSHLGPLGKASEVHQPLWSYQEAQRCTRLKREGERAACQGPSSHLDEPIFTDLHQRCWAH